MPEQITDKPTILTITPLSGSHGAAAFLFFFCGILIMLLATGVVSGTDVSVEDYPMVVCFGMIFSAVGVVFAWRSPTLYIDASTRILVRQWGLLAFKSRRDISLIGLKQVELTKRATQIEDSTTVCYPVVLVWEEGREALEVSAPLIYSSARELAKGVCQLLGQTLVDRTDGTAERRDAGHLDESLVERLHRIEPLTDTPEAPAQMVAQLREVDDGLEITIASRAKDEQPAKATTVGKVASVALVVLLLSQKSTGLKIVSGLVILVATVIGAAARTLQNRTAREGLAVKVTVNPRELTLVKTRVYDWRLLPQLLLDGLVAHKLRFTEQGKHKNATQTDQDLQRSARPLHFTVSAQEFQDLAIASNISVEGLKQLPARYRGFVHQALVLKTATDLLSFGNGLDLAELSYLRARILQTIAKAETKGKGKKRAG